MVLVAVILIESVVLWTRVAAGTKQVAVKETPFVMTRLAAEEQG